MYLLEMKQGFCFLQQLHSAAVCNFNQLLHNCRADASLSSGCRLSQVGLRRGLLGGVSVCEGAHAGVQPQNGSCTCQPGYHGKKCQKGITHSQLPHVCLCLCPSNRSFFLPSALFGCCYSYIHILLMILWGFNPARVAGTSRGIELKNAGVLA